MRRLGLALVAAAAIIVPATAQAAPPAVDLNVQWLTPRPGEVVDAGVVYVRGVAVSASGVDEVTLSIDGHRVDDADIDRSTPTSVRVSTRRRVGVGDHLARIEFTDTEGRSHARAWRFTATDRRIGRLSGADRIDTAVTLSADLFDAGGADAAVLARADELADALAGVPLAHALDATLLLTDRHTLSPPVAAELRRAVADGAEVHLLGGSAALAPAVEEAVGDLAFAPVRHAGADRYETAADVARRLPGEGGTAIVASGTSFADALAASAPAAADGMPVLLTRSGELPRPARDLLRDRGVDRAVVVGGSAVVGEAVVDELGEVVAAVERVSGHDRYATAAAVVNRFAADAGVVGLASGTSFADALAGARHAAERGHPLALTASDALPAPTDSLMRRLRPGRFVAYGGTAVLGDDAVRTARRAAVDGPDAPRVTETDPAAGATVGALDTITVQLDRELVLRDSDVYVELDGAEVLGEVTQGDFTDTLVFRVAKIVREVKAGRSYPVRVSVVGRAGEEWVHDEIVFTYRKVELTRGDVGDDVMALQRQLTELGYWLGDPDGRYGSLTTQAVMAFEKTHGLPRDGVLDAQVRERLRTATRPTPRSEYGRVIEIDKARQILMIVVNGSAEWTFNTSTGTEEYYRHDGQRRLAHTPTGRFQIGRQINGMRDAPLGKLWRPKYFVGGIAVHGSTSVPAYGASHGCVRVTYPAMDFIWEQDLAPLGTDVWVY